MQIGVVTVDGRQVGVVAYSVGNYADTFTPNIDGYVPEGRAADSPQGALPHHYPGHHHPVPISHGSAAHTSDRAQHHTSHEGHAPQGKTYTESGGHPVQQGSAEVDQAIVEAARAHHLDPNFMRSVASIESGMNPSSNANRSTQYKGLYQIGSRGSGSEWERFGGGGNIYSARENAMGAARMFAENARQFKQHFGREPTDTEMYLMHQQGLGFYTRGAMTNIGGNPYPGMHGAQTHESFEAGWGREVARRKAQYTAKNQTRAEAPKDVTFNPETMAP